MASILDFMINYISDDEQKTSAMFSLTPKSYKINKLSNFEPEIEKRGLIIILIIILLLVHMKLNFAAFFVFFHLNLFVDNVYF